MGEGFHIGDVRIAGRVLVAPMTGVTDLPFRRLLSALGASYVATEMVASAELARGRPDAIRRAAIGDGLPQMVVQLVGADAKMLAAGARLSEVAGADIIDLNMGCPAKEVTGVRAGSALMRDLDQAERLIDATVNATGRPVSLKMRLGWDEAARNAPELAARAERCGVRAITVHARTRAQFYKGSAEWTAVAAVRGATRLPLIVNGDIVDATSARQALGQSGADAVMVGRGVYGRPWIAAAIQTALGSGADVVEPDAPTRLEIVRAHLGASCAFYGDALGLRVFRKHLGWYIEQAPWPASAERRREAKANLCRLESASDVVRSLSQLWQAA